MRLYVISFSVIVASLCCGYERSYILAKIVTTCFMTEWQFLLTSKLPQMATICLMAEVAKNGNYLPHGRSCQKWQLLASW